MSLPYINVVHYLNLIQKAAAQKMVVCAYCNADSFSNDSVWICSNCELANTSATFDMRMGDQAIVQRMRKVEQLLSVNDFDGAELEYTNIVNTYHDPESHYYCALLNMKCSNAELAAVRYDRKGFMEENSVHIENASKRKSRALLLLNRASLMCDKKLKTAGNPVLAFTFFMVSIKLGNMKTARRAKETIRSFGNLYLSKYAEMVFNAQLNRPDETARAAANLLLGSVSMNGVYYIAWALFKHGRYDNALKLLGALRKYMDTSNVDALMQGVVREKALPLL